MVTRHGKPVAATLPPAEVEVRQQHQRAEADQARQKQAEEDRGQRLPGKQTPVCPWCGSSCLHVVYVAPVAALVNTADPAAGIPAVVVDADQPPPSRPPRPPGRLRHRREPPAPPADQGDVVAVYTTTRDDTHSARTVTVHDVARGKLLRVTTWEWLTGILDSERAQLHDDTDDRGWVRLGRPGPATTARRPRAASLRRAGRRPPLPAGNGDRQPGMAGLWVPDNSAPP